jgi:hypothetical protein
VNWVFWAPLCAASLHIFEEFVLPGGFASWYRRYRPDIQKSITLRFLVIVNLLLLILCYDVAVLRLRPMGVGLWLTVAALLSSNAIWHVVGAVRTRSYSPGMITGLSLYLPLTFYGYARFLRSGKASTATAIAAFAIGGSYHLWSSAFHSLRGAKA